jgi:hypothetical protein
MSGLDTRSLAIFESSLIRQLKDCAKPYNINVDWDMDSAPECFARLISGLYDNEQLKNKNLKSDKLEQNFRDSSLKMDDNEEDIVDPCVVLLIDEYDAPMISLLQDDIKGRDHYKLITNIRKLLHQFYFKIKNHSAHLYFTFITGVTKLSRTSFLSDLNKLTDISLEEDFGALVGFTHDELIGNFAAHIEAAAKELGLTLDSFLGEFKNYYEGFCFDGLTKLYNPYSTLLFFRQEEKHFEPFWMASGSSQFIKDKLAKWKVQPDSFRGNIIGSNVAKYPGEIDKTDPNLFLYQAGYLTIREKHGADYILDYPNSEVLQSMNRLFLENCYPPGQSSKVETDCNHLKNALNAQDGPMIIEVLNHCLFTINYNALYKMDRSLFDQPINKADSANAPVKPKNKKTKVRLPEFFFQYLFYFFFIGAGYYTDTEAENIFGRGDLVIYHDKASKAAIVLEAKIIGQRERAQTAAKKGFKQIKDRGFGGQLSNPFLISLAIDAENREILAGIFEKQGHLTFWPQDKQ